MNKGKPTAYGMLLLILAQTMVGLNIVASKLLLTSIPVLIVLTIRFALAGLILLPLHWLSSARYTSITTHFKSITSRDWIFIIAQALTAGVLFNFFMLTGLKYTDANVAGIITSALPAMIAVMSWLVLKEKISLQICLCIGFATTGLLLIAYEKFNTLNTSHSFLGDFIVLLALLPEATYYVLCKLHTQRLPVFLASSLINVINTLILLPFVFMQPWVPIDTCAFNCLILFILSLSSGLFYVFWFMGAKHVDGMLASLSTAIMPVVTVIFAYYILSEDLSGMQLIGMSLVILSIVLYAKK